MRPPTIRDVPSNRLHFALFAAYDEAMRYIVESTGSEAPSGPFAVALYDLGPSAPGLKREEFLNTERVLEVMDARRITYYGTPGYHKPIEGERYAVPGRAQNLSPLEITAIKAAEILVTGTDNLRLVHSEGKWPGACASFGGEPLNQSVGSNSWPLAVASSGYLPKFVLRVTTGAAANVEFELIEMGAVPVDPVVSGTFLLGDRSTWHYPTPAS